MFLTIILGRILNRFSKDQNAIDESLSQSMLTMLNQTFLAIGVFCTIALVSPLFIALLLPIGIHYFFIILLFNLVTKIFYSLCLFNCTIVLLEDKQRASKTWLHHQKSCICTICWYINSILYFIKHTHSYYPETLTGLSTIRSTKSSGRFIAENNSKIDANTRMMHNIQAVNRWYIIHYCNYVLNLNLNFNLIL